jgi:hypothetical protein
MPVLVVPGVFRVGRHWQPAYPFLQVATPKKLLNDPPQVLESQDGGGATQDVGTGDAVDVVEVEVEVEVEVKAEVEVEVEVEVELDVELEVEVVDVAVGLIITEEG